MTILKIKNILVLSICLAGTWSAAQAETGVVTHAEIGVVTQAEIGVVTYAKGDVQAMLDGKVRKLQRRSELFTGDEIKTGGRSSVKLRFSDNSTIDLKPNTDFFIKKYLYSQKQSVESGGNSAFSSKLLKGGLSAVTGSIARVNPSQYHMEVGLKNKKPIAVIAVRGTRWTLSFSPKNGKVYVKVNEGLIAFNGVAIKKGDRAEYTVKTSQVKIIDSTGKTSTIVASPDNVAEAGQGEKKSADADESIKEDTTDQAAQDEQKPSDGDDMLKEDATDQSSQDEKKTYDADEPGGDATDQSSQDEKKAYDADKPGGDATVEESTQDGQELYGSDDAPIKEATADQQVEVIEDNADSNDKILDTASAGGSSSAPGTLDDQGYSIVDSAGFAIPIPLWQIRLFSDESTSAFSGANADLSAAALSGDELTIIK
jgi:hypothetical protein